MSIVELEHTVASTISYARQISGVRVVNTPADYNIAGNDLAGIKTKAKELTEKRLEMTRPLDESKKRIMELFKKPLDALAEAENLIKSQMLNYSARVAEEQRKEREAAEREAARLAAEARQKEAEARRLAAEARTLEEAKAARVALAEAKEIAAQAVEPEIELSVMPKAVGISTREVWKFEIVNAALVPREYLVPDEKKIGAVARAMTSSANIPGVRVYSEKILATKTY